MSDADGEVSGAQWAVGAEPRAHASPPFPLPPLQPCCGRRQAVSFAGGRTDGSGRGGRRSDRYKDGVSWWGRARRARTSPASTTGQARLVVLVQQQEQPAVRCVLCCLACGRGSNQFADANAMRIDGKEQGRQLQAGRAGAGIDSSDGTVADIKGWLVGGFV